MTVEKTLMLIEDNPDDAELTLRAFRRNGIASPIHVANSGIEALEWLFARASQPDLPLPVVILLDLRMPLIDGFEVLRRIRADERTRLVPVVILTSSREESDLVNGYRLGANSYVRKPVDFTQFMEVARDLSRYWLTWNELPRALTTQARS